MFDWLKKMFGSQLDSVDILIKGADKINESEKRKRSKWAKDMGVDPEDLEGIRRVAYHGTEADLKRFLTKEPRLVKYRSDFDGTLLYIVCGRAFGEQAVIYAMAMELLRAGVDVNFANVDGLTALHEAVSHRRQDLVQLLLTHGAKFYATKRGGTAPIHRADTESMVELLLKNGADINTKDAEGHTLLDRLLFYTGPDHSGQRRMEGDNHLTHFVRECEGVSPMEEASKTSYDALPEDEKLALTLRWSGKRWGVLAGGGDEVEKTEVKKIGQYLYEHGGMTRMRNVHRRVVELGGDGRYLEFTWHGIGEWLG